MWLKQLFFISPTHFLSENNLIYTYEFGLFRNVFLSKVIVVMLVCSWHVTLRCNAVPTKIVSEKVKLFNFLPKKRGKFREKSTQKDKFKIFFNINHLVTPQIYLVTPWKGPEHIQIPLIISQTRCMFTCISSQYQNELDT